MTRGAASGVCCAIVSFMMHVSLTGWPELTFGKAQLTAVRLKMPGRDFIAKLSWPPLRLSRVRFRHLGPKVVHMADNPVAPLQEIEDRAELFHRGAKPADICRPCR